jgi:hypothetical protein
LRFAARGTGEGARLAHCGIGGNEKLGLNGIAGPAPLAFGKFREPWFGGGVNGGIVELVGPLDFVSPGLGLEFVSEVPASDGLDSRITGGCVAEVGVGRGGGCDCMDDLVATVDLRFLLGCPFPYCGCCEGSECCW